VTLAPGLSRYFLVLGAALRECPAWEPDLALHSSFMVWLVVRSTQLLGSAARVGEHGSLLGYWLWYAIIGLGLVVPVSGADLWVDALLPFFSGASLAVLGTYARDMVLGPSCFTLSRQEAQQLVREASHHCCHELEEISGPTTSSTTLPLDSWDTFWSSMWWAKMGFILGMAVCSLVLGVAALFCRGHVGSNAPRLPALPPLPSPAVHHVSADSEAKAALAREQIQIVRQRLNKVLE
jgi:hypothetical protein